MNSFSPTVSRLIRRLCVSASLRLCVQFGRSIASIDSPARLIAKTPRRNAANLEPRGTGAGHWNREAAAAGPPPPHSRGPEKSSRYAAILTCSIARRFWPKSKLLESILFWTFPLRASDLFRISNFGFRICLTVSLSFAICAGTAHGQTNDAEKLTLSQAHDLALRNHPQIAAANYRAMAAEEIVKEVSSGSYPLVNLYGSAVGADSANTRILAGGLNNPSVFDRLGAGVAVSQLLTDFGRTANLTASSRFDAQAEHLHAAATREDVLLRVDANYFGALQALAVLQVARQTVDTRQLLVDRVSLMASNGLKTDLDVSFAKFQV